MDEVSTSLKVSLLIFALALISTLGMMVLRSDQLTRGFEYSAAEGT